MLVFVSDPRLSCLLIINHPSKNPYTNSYFCLLPLTSALLISTAKTTNKNNQIDKCIHILVLILFVSLFIAFIIVMTTSSLKHAWHRRIITWNHCQYQMVFRKLLSKQFCVIIGFSRIFSFIVSIKVHIKNCRKQMLIVNTYKYIARCSERTTVAE